MRSSCSPTGTRPVVHDNERSSPSVSEASHGRYLSLFTRSMSADTILSDEDQSEEGE